MHRADEDGAEDNPQQSGQPAPKHGNCGSDDRPSAGDARKMMPKNNLALRGDEIDVILELATWHFCVRGDIENPSRKPTTVGVISDDETGERRQGNQ